MKKTLTLTRALGVVALAALTAGPAALALDQTQDQTNQNQTESQVVHPEATTRQTRDQKLAQMQATTDGTYASGSELSGDQLQRQQAGMAGGTFSKIDPKKDRMLSVMQADTDGTPRGDSFSQPKDALTNAPYNAYQLADDSVPATYATNSKRTNQEIIAMRGGQSSDQLNTAAAAPQRSSQVSSDQYSNQAQNQVQPQPQTQTQPRTSSQNNYQASNNSSSSSTTSEYSSQGVSRHPHQVSSGSHDLTSHVILYESALHSALIQAQGLQSQLNESKKSGKSYDLSSFKTGSRELQADLNTADSQRTLIKSRIHQYPDLARSGEFNKLDQSYRDLKPVESSWKSHSMRAGFWKDQQVASNELNQLTTQLQNALKASHSFSVAKLDIKSLRSTG